MLSFDASTTERLAEVIGECRRMEIPIRAPDINSSDLKFAPEETGGGIRFGLASIKNVGAGAMEAAVAERERNGPFASFEDFCARLDSRTVNRKILESLVKCGAFDCFGRFRSQLFADIDAAMGAAASRQRDRASGQVSLFGEEDLGGEAKRPEGVEVEPWPQHEMLAYEKELLGYYVSGHPLDRYAGHFDGGKYLTIAGVQQIGESATVKLAGLVASVEKKFTRKDGKPFGVFVLEDFTGAIEMTAWDESFTKHAALLVPGTAVSVSARLTRRDEAIRATAGQIAALKPKASVRAVRLRLARDRMSGDDLERVLDAVKAHAGERPLILEFVTGDGGVIEIPAGEEFGVGDESGLLAAVAGFRPGND
jgi:DNA polymerase-3 subunit alpha